MTVFEHALAVGYIRVSTEKQRVKGVSLDAQTERVRAWAKSAERTLIEPLFRDEGLSGMRMDNRPQLLAAIEAACRERCPLVVYSLSRLARARRDIFTIADRLHKAGADLVSVTESIDTTTAMGNAFFGILAVLAQLESDLAGERTTEAAAWKRRHNERFGFLPYGWRIEGERIDAEGNPHALLVPNQAEQEIMALIKAERERGASLRCVARRLAADGVPTKNGGTWSAATIRSILRQTERSRP